MICGKIVLTGGPNAGKTTALARIEENLIEKGYRVLIVSESASELIKGGIRPFGDRPFDMVDFQRVIIPYQLQKEASYEYAASLLPDEKCVLIYDRGVLDNKAYITPEQFTMVLEENGFRESDLLERYDMVLHLVTAADGKEEYYGFETNDARYEDIAEAIRLDRVTAQAWLAHPHLSIIDNTTEFEEKITRVLEQVDNFLGEPVSLRQQRKFKVDIDHFDPSMIEGALSFPIEQIYLEGNDGYERRLRKRTYQGEKTYYFTVQKCLGEGYAKVVTDKKISEKEYERLSQMYDKTSTIHKTRYAFIRNKQYFRLDVFTDLSLAVLEIEATKDNQDLVIPEEIPILEEVTNDPNYQTRMLSKTDCKQFVLTKK